MSVMSFQRVTARLRALPQAAALIIVTCAPLMAMAAERGNDDLVGIWTLAKVLDSSEITSIDEAEAAALVGKTLVIAPDKVTFAGQRCKKPPRFIHHYEDAARYIRETAHAPVGRLGVPTTVEAVDLTCTEALIKGYKRIVIYWQGFFFDAVKQQ
jgi:hypothetical protein